MKKMSVNYPKVKRAQKRNNRKLRILQNYVAFEPEKKLWDDDFITYIIPDVEISNIRNKFSIREGQDTFLKVV